MKNMKKQIFVYLMLLSLLLSGSIGVTDVYAAESTENSSILEETYDYNLKTEDILIRDPYVVVHDGKYYMYGTDGTNAFGGQMDSFPVWVSEDLENWAGPYTIFQNDGSFWADSQYWAPEVYYIDGEFYLYGSMGGSKAGPTKESSCSNLMSRWGHLSLCQSIRLLRKKMMISTLRFTKKTG